MSGSMNRIIIYSILLIILAFLNPLTLEAKTIYCEFGKKSTNRN